MIFRARDYTFDLARRVLVMGIVNVTPDSFSDGGQRLAAGDAIDHGLALAAAGADILDIGGESTRPGAEPIDEAEELRRVLPVIAGLRGATAIPISVDTTKAAVAREALAAGAAIINDISGFQRDPAMIEVAAAGRAGCIVMHMRGTPQTMQQHTVYADLLGEVEQFFRQVTAAMHGGGVGNLYIAYDPGIGFSKTATQNLLLLRHLARLQGLGRPLLVGPSRKSFIGKVLGIADPGQRSWGTAAAVSAAVLAGARMVRVHEVGPMRQVADMALAIATAEE
jgi:dihydropteroate synthase